MSDFNKMASKDITIVENADEQIPPAASAWEVLVSSERREWTRTYSLPPTSTVGDVRGLWAAETEADRTAVFLTVQGAPAADEQRLDAVGETFPGSRFLRLVAHEAAPLSVAVYGECRPSAMVLFRLSAAPAELMDAVRGALELPGDQGLRLRSPWALLSPELPLGAQGLRAGSLLVAELRYSVQLLDPWTLTAWEQRLFASEALHALPRPGEPQLQRLALRGRPLDDDREVAEVLAFLGALRSRHLRLELHTLRRVTVLAGGRLSERRLWPTDVLPSLSVWLLMIAEEPLARRQPVCTYDLPEHGLVHAGAVAVQVRLASGLRRVIHVPQAGSVSDVRATVRAAEGHDAFLLVRGGRTFDDPDACIADVGLTSGAEVRVVRSGLTVTLELVGRTQRWTTAQRSVRMTDIRNHLAEVTTISLHRLDAIVWRCAGCRRAVWKEEEEYQPIPADCCGVRSLHLRQVADTASQCRAPPLRSSINRSVATGPSDTAESAARAAAAEEEARRLQSAHVLLLRNVNAKEEELRRREDEISRLHGVHNDLRDELSALHLHLEQQREKNKELQEENGSLKTTTQTLQEENGSLKRTTQTLQEENGSLKTTTQTLQEENGSLKTTTQTLQEKNGALKRTMQTLQEENGSLKTTTQTLQEEDGALKRTTHSLQEENGALKRTTSALRVENRELQSRVSKLLEEMTAAVSQEKEQLRLRARQLELELVALRTDVRAVPVSLRRPNEHPLALRLSVRSGETVGALAEQLRRCGLLAGVRQMRTAAGRPLTDNAEWRWAPLDVGPQEEVVVEPLTPAEVRVAVYLPTDDKAAHWWRMAVPRPGATWGDLRAVVLRRAGRPADAAAVVLQRGSAYRREGRRRCTVRSFVSDEWRGAYVDADNGAEDTGEDRTHVIVEFLSLDLSIAAAPSHPPLLAVFLDPEVCALSPVGSPRSEPLEALHDPRGLFLLRGLLLRFDSDGAAAPLLLLQLADSGFCDTASRAVFKDEAAAAAALEHGRRGISWRRLYIIFRDGDLLPRYRLPAETSLFVLTRCGVTVDVKDGRVVRTDDGTADLTASKWSTPTNVSEFEKKLTFVMTS